MRPQAPNEAEKEDAPYTTVLSFFGFSLFLTWCFMCLFDFPSLLAGITDSDISYLFFVALFFMVFAAALGICGLMADRFNLFPNGKVVAIGIGLIVLISLTSALPMDYAVPAFLVAGCILSALSAYFLLCWLNLMSRTVTSMTAIYYAVATCTAALIGFFLLSLDHPLSELVALLLLLIQSLSMLAVSKKTQPPVEQVKRKESGERRPLYWKTHLTFDSMGLVFGLMFFELVSIDAPILVTLAVIVGAIVASADIWHAGGVYTEWLRRYVLIVMMLGLLALPFLKPSDTWIIWCMFAGLFTCFFIIQPNWNIVASRKYHLNIIALVPNGQTHIWIAMGMGYFLGWFMYGMGLESIWLTQALLAPLCVFAVFHTSTDMQDMQRLAFKDDEPDDAGTSNSNEPRLHRFFGYCNSIAYQYKLTPRESEILILLAKGRNASRIASILVLSNHTVKTHIYHIYQKLGINSQQELIDRVDKAVLRSD